MTSMFYRKLQQVVSQGGSNELMAAQYQATPESAWLWLANADRNMTPFLSSNLGFFMNERTRSGMNNMAYRVVKIQTDPFDTERQTPIPIEEVFLEGWGDLARKLCYSTEQ